MIATGKVHQCVNADLGITPVLIGTGSKRDELYFAGIHFGQSAPETTSVFGWRYTDFALYITAEIGYR